VEDKQGLVAVDLYLLRKYIYKYKKASHCFLAIGWLSIFYQSGLN
jgi:hypothetical protein